MECSICLLYSTYGHVIECHRPWRRGGDQQLCGCDASLEGAGTTLSTHNAYKRAQKAHADISCDHASRRPDDLEGTKVGAIKRSTGR